MHHIARRQQRSNGRVDVREPQLPPEHSNLRGKLTMQDRMPANQCATLRDATIGLWDRSTLSDLFFSAKNMQILQNGIRAGVYELSNGRYVVGPQDCDALSTVMRSVFLQHAVNLPQDITGQIAALNAMVLDYCIKAVYGEAKGYMKYVDDVSTLVVPMALPMLERQKDKTNYKMPGWFGETPEVGTYM